MSQEKYFLKLNEAKGKKAFANRYGKLTRSSNYSFSIVVNC